MRTGGSQRTASPHLPFTLLPQDGQYSLRKSQWARQVELRRLSPRITPRSVWWFGKTQSEPRNQPNPDRSSNNKSHQTVPSIYRMEVCFCLKQAARPGVTAPASLTNTTRNHIWGFLYIDLRTSDVPKIWIYNKRHGDVIFLSFLFVEIGFFYVALAGWPWTQRSTGLCLLNAGTKGVCHHTQLPILLLVIAN